MVKRWDFSGSPFVYDPPQYPGAVHDFSSIRVGQTVRIYYVDRHTYQDLRITKIAYPLVEACLWPEDHKKRRSVTRSFIDMGISRAAGMFYMRYTYAIILRER